MGVDVGGVNAAFGQDVDPEAVEFEFSRAEVKGEVARKGGDVFVQHLDQILEDREAVGQVVEGGVGGVAGIAVFLAPVLARFIIVGDGDAGGIRVSSGEIGARRALDVMAVDLQNAVVGENSAILVPSSSGSGTLFASLTTRRAPAASPASRFLAVGYTLNASNQLYRSYAAVNYTNTDLLAATASVITALPVEPLANGILAVQIHAIPENTLPLNLVTDNYNGTPTPTDWNALVTRSPAFASSFKGRTRAIEIWIAAIDQQSLQLLPTAFKPTNAEPSQWRSEVDDSAIPAQAKSSIRILKKTILLP